MDLTFCSIVVGRGDAAARVFGPDKPVKGPAWPATCTPSVLGATAAFGRVESMSESESARSEPGAEAESGAREVHAGGDPLAARLLAVQRVLRGLNVDPDLRMRLHLRFMAICTSLKMPSANRLKGAERLDRLMADAERARGGETREARNRKLNRRC